MTPLLAWVRLLVLSASRPDRAFSARTVGRSGGGRATISIATIRPIGADATDRKEQAEAHLRALVAVFRRGMCEPLPLYLRPSAAWAGAVALGQEPTRSAAAQWTSSYSFDNEDRDAEHRVADRAGQQGVGPLAGALGDELGDDLPPGGEPQRRVRMPG